MQHSFGSRDEHSMTGTSISMAVASSRDVGGSSASRAFVGGALLAGQSGESLEVHSRILSARNMKKAADMGLQLKTPSRKLDLGLGFAPLHNTLSTLPFTLSCLSVDALEPNPSPAAPQAQIQATLSRWRMLINLARVHRQRVVSLSL